MMVIIALKKPRYMWYNYIVEHINKPFVAYSIVTQEVWKISGMNRMTVDQRAVHMVDTRECHWSVTESLIVQWKY